MIFFGGNCLVFLGRTFSFISVKKLILGILSNLASFTIQKNEVLTPRILHIINPVKVSVQSDLFFAQPITFESLINAKKYSKFSESITLATTQFEEDKPIIPEGFLQLSNLQRSILDLNPQLKGKKLPLVIDILNKTKEFEACDFIVYSNMDIGVLPQFYDVLYRYISQGHDAVLINRRRVSSKFKNLDDLPLIYSELGDSHPGFDCFLFKKELLEQFILEEICIGIPFLEVSFLHNLFSFAANPIFVPDIHLTFHLGMEVLPPVNKEFYWHNRKVFFEKINPKLKSKYDLKKFPYGHLPFPHRTIKWILNPSIFTRTYLELENKNFWYRIKFRLNEIRWRILQK